MCRMDTSKSIFDPAVAKFTFLPEHYDINQPGTISPKIIAIKDELEKHLTPYEVKITKSKDAGRDERTYMLMCKQNLRIYNHLGEYISDMKRLDLNSRGLERDINKLLNTTINNIMDINEPDFGDDNIIQDNSNIELMSNTEDMPPFLV